MKKIFKFMLSLLSVIILLPILLAYKLQLFFTKSERFFNDCAQLVSMIPGTLGNYIRKEYYKFTLKKCSNSCSIGFRTIISHPDAEIGEGAYIGINCMIGTVCIENDVLIGSNVDIIDGKRTHSFDSLEIPVRLQERNIVKITIGKDSWIGNSAVVMANVGEGCVIGAGSVVVDDLESFAVAVGNPARTIRKRK